MASSPNNLTAITSAEKTLRRYEFDLETNGFLDVVSVIHSLVIRDIDTGEVTSCADHKGYAPVAIGIAMLANATLLVGHNIIGYDIPVIQKLYPDWSTEALLHDTLILTQLFFPELRALDFKVREKDIKANRTPVLPGNMIGLHRLEAWGYRLGKMKGDYSDIMKAEGRDPWAHWNTLMQEYCVQDVEVTHALYEMIQKQPGYAESAFAIWIEMRFADLMIKQERHGFRFDVAAAERLEAELNIHKASIQDKLSTLFEPWWAPTKTHTPKNTSCMFVQSEHGAVLRTVKEDTGRSYEFTYKNGKTITRKEKVDVVQRGYYEYTEADSPFLRVELRVFNPSSRLHIADRLKKVFGWVPTEYTDGGDVKIDDDILSALPWPAAQELAENFMLEKRLSMLSDGKQAWLKQVRLGRIHGRVKTLGAITGRCTHSNPNIAQVPSCENARGVVPYGAACRALFLPDEGHVLVGCDADGLELRDLAHFMQDGGRYAKAVDEGSSKLGTDIHTVNQKAAGLPTRPAAKTFIYAFLYGAGDELIGQIVLPQGTPEEQRRAGAALKKQFLDGTPGLKGLIKAVKASAKYQGWVRGLDGRRVPVRHQHAALNSLLQNAGAVAMKLALVILYDALIAEGLVWGSDFAFLANIHDEFQISARPEVSQRVAELATESITDAGARLNMKIPLRGTAKIGNNWKETH